MKNVIAGPWGKKTATPVIPLGENSLPETPQIERVKRIGKETLDRFRDIFSENIETGLVLPRKVGEAIGTIGNYSVSESKINEAILKNNLHALSIDEIVQRLEDSSVQYIQTHPAYCKGLITVYLSKKGEIQTLSAKAIEELFDRVDITEEAEKRPIFCKLILARYYSLDTPKR